MAVTSDTVAHPEAASKTPEMGDKYAQSRFVAKSLAIATCVAAGYLFWRGDATNNEVEILGIVSGLAMIAVGGWMGSSNGREAYVEGKFKNK